MKVLRGIQTTFAALKGTLLMRWLASGFGVGHIFPAPGTAGSLLGLLLALPVLKCFPNLFPWSAFGMAVLGIWVCHRAVGEESDPPWVVLDEIVGLWIALLGNPLSWSALLLAFLLFRLFDIWKPWPARELERLPGGFGIVLDDVVAGLYTASILNFFLMGDQ